MFLLSGLFLYASITIGQAPDAGWFAYVLYSTARFTRRLNLDFYTLALIFLTISGTAGAINFIVTIFRLRAPGMTISRMPLLLYSTLTVSFSILFALPALTAACIFLELDRQWARISSTCHAAATRCTGSTCSGPSGIPRVYIIFLPATGMVSMLLPVLARRPIMGYPYVAVATVLTGLVGLGVWVHHMFAVGMPFLSMSFFSAASMTISIFSAIQVFAWIATLWTGHAGHASPQSVR